MLPKEIKVGGIDYAVQIKDIETTEGLQLGLCDFGECRIAINSRVAEARQQQTLIHELVHAVFVESGIEVEDEEDLVNRIGFTMYQVLKDNDFGFLRPNEEETIVTSYYQGEKQEVIAND